MKMSHKGGGIDNEEDCTVEHGVEDVGREDGMHSEGCLMIWTDDSEWIELTANIEEGVLVSVVGAVVKG